MNKFNKYISVNTIRFGIVSLFAICFLNSFSSLSNNILECSSSSSGFENRLSFQKSDKEYDLIRDHNVAFENENNEDENDDNDNKDQHFNHLFSFVTNQNVCSARSDILLIKQVENTDDKFSLPSVVSRYILFQCWKHHLS